MLRIRLLILILHLLLGAAKGVGRTFMLYHHFWIITAGSTVYYMKIIELTFVRSATIFSKQMPTCSYTREMPPKAVLLRGNVLRIFSCTCSDYWKKEPPDRKSHHSLTLGKSFSEWERLQSETEAKMRSGDAKVVEYWDALLTNLHIFKPQQALALVFVETKKGADSLELWLCVNDFPATTIHRERTHQTEHFQGVCVVPVGMQTFLPKKGADSLELWLCMNVFPATTIHRERTHQTEHFQGVCVVLVGMQTFLPAAQMASLHLFVLHQQVVPHFVLPHVEQFQSVLAVSSLHHWYSQELPNRLGEMIAPLLWHDYKRKYGKREDFVASHPEMFVIERDTSSFGKVHKKPWLLLQLLLNLTRNS